MYSGSGKAMQRATRAVLRPEAKRRLQAGIKVSMAKRAEGKPLVLLPLSTGERAAYEIGLKDGAELLAARMLRKIKALK